METKICIRCKIEKDITNFVKDRRRKFINLCKQCHNKEQRDHRHNDPKRFRGYGLKKYYKLTLDQFELILKFQNNQCAICKTNISSGHGTWHVDHDHSCCINRETCGKCIRGLLCTNCNSVLGFAKDDINTLKASIKYLKRGALDVESITRINRNNSNRNGENRENNVSPTNQ